ncbi:unnamed protein product [Kuraishia capsulata CBS 1993]|uniref:Thioesterase domain-containing protein n=1 Tax=Kuraishia capsulata CBS 1993 TaxID=1382522 RepID=W6MGL9_9ASCO|nr:uncharacterized protein KUCA_T00000943001 [Kuraishia capsulata CBS 1993]CDK24976.1 unnamed protein product [Kuraishia capsulata CBS 1993]
MIGTVFKWLSIAILLSSYKSLPGSYYVRFYYALMRIVLFSKTSNKGKDILKVKSRLLTFCSLGECDFYLHKSNSTFLEEMDMARTELMLSLYKPLFAIDKLGSWPFLPVGSVDISFLKEIKPFQKYWVDSRVVSWDEKWLFVLSEFKVSSGKGERVCCTAITKYVFKDPKTRATIPPAIAAEKSGLVFDEQEIEANYASVSRSKEQLNFS